jgi:putative membrane protein insertion efficiency factor
MSSTRMSLVARALHGLVRFYRLFFSAWLGSGCRFSPSCSVYALESLERHDVLNGSYLTARRLLRCHPGCAGGHDPVPTQAPLWPGRQARTTHQEDPTGASTPEISS